MTIDREILLYCIAKVFQMIGIKMSEETLKYILDRDDHFNKLDIEDKIYFYKYGIRIMEKIMDYVEDIFLFEIDIDEEDVEYEFILHYSEDKKILISLDHRSLKINNVIPKKLMKICGYNGNTKVNKSYLEEYKKICQEAHDQVGQYGKYSDIPEDEKNEYIIDPMINLISNTLSRKRKCADKLYSYLFDGQNRMVLKLYKNRFILYDYGKDLEEINSFKISTAENQLSIVFNNDAKFIWTLNTNASSIKEQLSIKFKVKFTNMDDIFKIFSSKI